MTNKVESVESSELRSSLRIDTWGMLLNDRWGPKTVRLIPYEEIMSLRNAQWFGCRYLLDWDNHYWVFLRRKHLAEFRSKHHIRNEDCEVHGIPVTLRQRIRGFYTLFSLV